MLGKWISAKGLEFDIQNISEYLISGRISLKSKQLVLDKVVNAVILKNSPGRMIFCFYFEYHHSIDIIENYMCLDFLNFMYF
jgi:hypothetical protein